MVNYGKKLVYVDGAEIRPVFTANGHYMINIFDDLQDILNVDDLNVKNVNSADDEVFLDTIMTDDISDEEMDLEVDVDEETIEEVILPGGRQEQDFSKGSQVLGGLHRRRQLGQVSSGQLLP